MKSFFCVCESVLSFSESLFFALMRVCFVYHVGVFYFRQCFMCQSVYCESVFCISVRLFC